MRSRTGRTSPKVDSVKELLERSFPVMTRLTDQAARQSFWREWLSNHLPADISARVSGIAEHDGQLVIFASSAAWSARLRYAVFELEGAIRAEAPGLSAIAVRVLPRS